MLKGLYDFSPISPKTLGFKANDKLLYLSGVERDENWLRVTNRRGQIGLVPINYVDVDRQMTGSAVIDFLDECLQISRREKSKFFTELQEIRKSILNPINDLERRLFEFEDVINKLKTKGSPFYNPSERNSQQLHEQLLQEEEEQEENLKKHKKSQQQQDHRHHHSSSYSSLNGKSPDRSSSPNAISDQDLEEVPDLENSPSPSFLTFVDDNDSKLSNRRKISYERNSSKNPQHNHGDHKNNDNNNDCNNNNSSNDDFEKSSTKSCCSYRQFIQSECDNESQHLEEDEDDHNNNNNIDNDGNSLSGKTSLTYICPPRKFSATKIISSIKPGGIKGSKTISKIDFKIMKSNNIKETNNNNNNHTPSNKVKKYENDNLGAQQELCEIIDNVRQSTGLSDELSHRAVHSVFKYLQQNFISQQNKNKSTKNQVQVQGQQNSNNNEEICFNNNSGNNNSNNSILNSTIENFLNLLENSISTSSPLHKSSSFLISSKDYERLDNIFKELCEQGKDEDKWVTMSSTSSLDHDYETGKLLEEMNYILREADERTIIKILEKNDYENLLSLTTYYQREHRWPRRQTLIEIFAAVATIDRRGLSVLVNSVLPLELSREMMSCHHRHQNGHHQSHSSLLSSFSKSTTKCSSSSSTSLKKMSPWTSLSAMDRERLETCGSLLGLLLSTGEKLPVTHLDFLGKNFLHFLLNGIEGCGNGDTEGENIANVFMNLILSYNLQFDPQDENLTVAALASRSNAKCLTQKTVHLLNWDEDPIAGCIPKFSTIIINPNQESSQQQEQQNDSSPNSVLKLVTEMFSCSKIADLFYTNDVKVLIDIVIRWTMDWEPGEKKRTLYLQLVRVIIRNSNFREHNHRRHDLVKMFTSILLEEDPLAIPDQRLIREISNEFPNFVKY